MDVRFGLSCRECGASNAEFDPKCAQCGAELTQQPGIAAATPAQEGPLEGQCLGPYRLVELLGRGSMGQVYKARHGSTGRMVALKTVRLPHAGLLQSLRREIQALSGLRHPLIVRILEHGVHESMPWYAMELVQGRTLRAWAQGMAEDAKTADEPWWTRTLDAPAMAGQGSRLSPSCGPEQTSHAGKGTREVVPLQAVLTVVRPLCSALAYLHGEGLVHRDLKPDNVLVRSSRGGKGARDGMPMLVDFGLAAGAAVGREALEPGGGGAGTPLYMAPEQIRAEALDARADLYSLGCILYELLTGQPPFQARSQRALLELHLGQAPRPPSELAPELPAALDELVLRLLAKEPRERIGHADDVAAALGALGADAGREAAGPKPRAYLYRPALAGRLEPLSRLEQALSELEEGPGGLVLIGGESGVGKTRLLLELGRSAERRQVGVLAGECVPAGSLFGLESAPAARGRSRQSPSFAGTAGPLEALRKPLQALGDHCREKGLAETERIFGRRGKVLALYEPSLSGLPGQEAHPEPAELPAQAAVLRLHAYLEETLSAYASRGSRGRAPTLVLLDDLQWADELSLGFLEYFMRVRSLGLQPAAPLLVVGTYRSEDVDTGLAEAGIAHASPLRRLIDRAGIVSIGLGRLDEAAVGGIVGDMLAITPPPALLSRHVARHSEGNPFFVAEYLRAAVAEELLYRDAQGRWQVVDQGEERATEATYEALPLPRSLRDLVGRRLAGLGPSARRLVQAAAVLGRESEPELLQQMIEPARAQGPEPVLAAVNELLRRQILEAAGPGRVRFVHDKLREVAYQGVAQRRRAALHRAAAEAIEGARQVGDAGDREEETASGLGHHWEQAGCSARAMPCYRTAARAAVKRHAHEQAERFYEAYLRLAEQPTAESVAARNELGEKVLALSGGNDEWLATHERALGEARRIGSRALEAESLRMLANVRYRSGRLQEAEALYEQALHLFRELADRRGEGMVLGGLGTLRVNQDGLQDAQELLQQAAAIARETGDRRSEGNVLCNLAVLHTDQGRMEKAQQLFGQALDLARQVGNQESESRVLANLARQQYQQGRIEEAQQLFGQALDLSRQVGERRLEGVVLDSLASLHHDQGRMEEARQLFGLALDRARQVGYPTLEGVVLGNLANLHRDQGRMEEARRCFEQALGLARQVGYRDLEAIVLGNLAGLHGDQGRPEEAQQLYEQALSIHRQLGNRRFEGLVLGDLAGLQHKQGRVEEARQLYEQALALRRQVGDRRAECLALIDLAELERHTGGDLERAADLAAQSEQLLIGVKEKIKLGKLLCGRGHIALAGGKSGRLWLERAQALSAEVGAGAESLIAKAVSKLLRAAEAFEAGEHHRLFRGELIADLPEGLRRWLVETGQFPG